MKFIALDVETANPNFSSICQIGIAHLLNGEFVESWSSLINPNEYFDSQNIMIHGITEKDVKNAPSWSDVIETIRKQVSGSITAIHTSFDKSATRQACAKHNIESLETTWLDTASVARRAWPQLAHKGYGLANLSEYLNIKFKHHDAVEDARAAGEVLSEPHRKPA